MKVNSTKTTETKELKNDDINKSGEECLCPCNMPFNALLQQGNPLTNSDLISSNSTNSLYSYGGLKSEFNYDSFTIDKDDAQFFADMVKKDGQFALNLQGDVNASLMQLNAANDIKSYKSANVSKTLLNLVDSAYNTQKPVRIDFDNNVSVILKVDKDGKVSAEFIPGDKAVEAYLRDNIPYLKQKFDEQNLSYNELSYRQNKQQQEQQNKKKNKGE